MLPQTSIPLCPPLSVALGGSAIELYDSNSFYDDLLWAAAWMYKATGAQTPAAQLAQGIESPAAVRSRARRAGVALIRVLNCEQLMTADTHNLW